MSPKYIYILPNKCLNGVFSFFTTIKALRIVWLCVIGQIVTPLLHHTDKNKRSDVEKKKSDISFLIC